MTAETARAIAESVRAAFARGDVESVEVWDDDGAVTIRAHFRRREYSLATPLKRRVVRALRLIQGGRA